MGCAQSVDDDRPKKHPITQIPIDSEFIIGEEIGRGAFSTVFRAEDRSGRKVALKCISLPQIRGELHLLTREMSILRELDHPNIVKLYGVFREDELIYLNMELCEGGSLKERLDKGAMSLAAVKEIARELLAALHYIHKHNIGHRDLKPENVLFTSEGQLKLADFGLARTMASMRPYSRVGTPYYLAPEVIHGDFNFQCDVWSAGVLFYYALVGTLPFEGENIKQLFSTIGQTVDLSPVPVEARGLVGSLLNADPSIRLTAEQALNEPWLRS
jgi:calcium-dependent protein kinase